MVEEKGSLEENDYCEVCGDGGMMHTHSRTLMILQHNYSLVLTLLLLSSVRKHICRASKLKREGKGGREGERVCDI